LQRQDETRKFGYRQHRTCASGKRDQRMQAFYRTLVFWKASALSVYAFNAGYSTHIVSTLG